MLTRHFPDRERNEETEVNPEAKSVSGTRRCCRWS